jgi:hypothetical protein
LGDEDIRVAPLGKVLSKDLTAGAVGFIADEEAIVGKKGTEQRAFASWSGTEVKGEAWGFTWRNLQA